MSGRIRDAQGRFTADPFAAVRDAARKAEADALATYRTACRPVPDGEWDNLLAQISDEVNQARIDLHRSVDQAYALILGEVPAREAPVAFVHQRGVVLELGGPAQKPIASAWQVPPGDTLAVSGEPHPSGPLPAGEWAIGVTGQLPADFDQRLASVLEAHAGQDAAGNVPGPVEYPPTPGPGTPGEAGE